MVHQHIAFAQRREDALGRFPVSERGMGGRHEWPVLECWTVQAVDLPQRRQVEQPAHLDDVAGMHVELT